MTKPLNLSNSSLLLEYIRVEPYVYTHKFDEINYLNYDRSIGHRGGPDSDELLVSYRNRPNWRSEVTLSWSMTRKGGLVTYSPPDSLLEDAKEFLSGTVERRFSYTLKYSLELAKDQFVQIEIGTFDWKNFSRLEGNDRTNNSVYLSYKLDF